MKSEEILESIFSYSDYREFLRDYFETKQTEIKGFSFRSFALRAGFSAHNFVAMVIRGERNLSRESAGKIIDALKLPNKHAQFFTHLVQLNQAKRSEDKDTHFDALRTIGRKVAVHHVEENHFFFYEKWYYPVIRELMVLVEWHDDPAILAKMVRPSISIPDARSAVEKILTSGMVIRNEDGSYYLQHQFVSSETVPIYVKKQARRDVLRMGVETVDSISPREKYASYATIPLSGNYYREIRAILDRVRQDILAGVEQDSQPEEIYELVLQLFPVSAIRGAKK